MTNGHSASLEPPTVSTAVRSTTVARAMLHPWRQRLIIQPGVGNHPCNLPMATTEPVQVMAPTTTEKPMETSTSRLGVMPSPLAANITPRATKSEERPPQPLNNATVSGMAVMGTSRAVSAPSTPPTAVPPAIQTQVTAVGWAWTRRPTTARAMALAASWLADRAERIFDRPLIPSASRATASRSRPPWNSSAELIDSLQSVCGRCETWSAFDRSPRSHPPH